MRPNLPPSICLVKRLASQAWCICLARTTFTDALSIYAETFLHHLCFPNLLHRDPQLIRVSRGFGVHRVCMRAGELKSICF
jgi:hypothetical protein